MPRCANVQPGNNPGGFWGNPGVLHAKELAAQAPVGPCGKSGGVCRGLCFPHGGGKQGRKAAEADEGCGNPGVSARPGRRRARLHCGQGQAVVSERGKGGGHAGGQGVDGANYRTAPKARAAVRAQQKPIARPASRARHAGCSGDSLTLLSLLTPGPEGLAFQRPGAAQATAGLPAYLPR